ncbi:recombinase family protein [bacterium]|nr:recombinase family protein [bacterium]
MKTIGYIRVSTASQVDDGVSIEAQEAKVRAWAELHNSGEVVIYRDEGQSGSRADNRLGLQQALDTVGDGDALIVYSLSRLSRSTKDTLAIADVLNKKGADLVSLSEKIDTTSAAGKMVFRMLAVMAEFERDQISDRTRFALAHKRSRGEKTGGDIPFGFRARDGRLHPVKNEQKVISFILKLRDDGLSLRKICRKLEEEGCARKKGSKIWHPQSVADIIRRHERDSIPAEKCQASCEG